MLTLLPPVDSLNETIQISIESTNPNDQEFQYLCDIIHKYTGTISFTSTPESTYYLLDFPKTVNLNQLIFDLNILLKNLNETSASPQSAISSSSSSSPPQVVSPTPAIILKKLGDTNSHHRLWQPTPAPIAPQAANTTIYAAEQKATPSKRQKKSKEIEKKPKNKHNERRRDQDTRRRRRRASLFVELELELRNDDQFADLFITKEPNLNELLKHGIEKIRKETKKNEQLTQQLFLETFRNKALSARLSHQQPVDVPAPATTNSLSFPEFSALSALPVPKPSTPTPKASSLSSNPVAFFNSMDPKQAPQLSALNSPPALTASNTISIANPMRQ